MRFLLVWHIDSHILWTNLTVAKMLVMLLIFYPIKATVPRGANYFFYLSLSVKLQYFLNLPKYFKERPTTLRKCNVGRFCPNFPGPDYPFLELCESCWATKLSLWHGHVSPLTAPCYNFSCFSEAGIFSLILSSVFLDYHLQREALHLKYFLSMIFWLVSWKVVFIDLLIEKKCFHIVSLSWCSSAKTSVWPSGVISLLLSS